MHTIDQDLAVKPCQKDDSMSGSMSFMEHLQGLFAKSGQSSERVVTYTTSENNPLPSSWIPLRVKEKAKPFAASVILLELREKSKNHRKYVRLFYINEGDTVIHRLATKGCAKGIDCSLKTFFT